MVSVGSSTQGPEWGCGVHSSVGSTRTQAWVGGCTSSDLPCILSLQPKAMLYLLPPPILQGRTQCSGNMMSVTMMHIRGYCHGHLQHASLPFSQISSLKCNQFSFLLKTLKRKSDNSRP